MKDCSNILVIIEPSQIRQPALMRAISLYNIAKNKNHEVKITAVLPIEKETFNIASVLAVDKKQYHEELVKKQSRWLKAYLSINAIDIKIESKVIFSKTPGKDIAQIAKQIGASLLIKSNEIHSILDNLFFTSLDTQMLRHAPIPVCIAKDIINTQKRPVAVAMDFSNPDDVILNYTNLRLLREAQKYALLTDGQIYLINAIAPVVPPVAVDLPGFNPEHLCSEIACQSKSTMIEFAKSINVFCPRCDFSMVFNFSFLTVDSTINFAFVLPLFHKFYRFIVCIFTLSFILQIPIAFTNNISYDTIVEC